MARNLMKNFASFKTSLRLAQKFFSLWYILSTLQYYRRFDRILLLSLFYRKWNMISRFLSFNIYLYKHRGSSSPFVPKTEMSQLATLILFLLLLSVFLFHKSKCKIFFNLKAIFLFQTLLSTTTKLLNDDLYYQLYYLCKSANRVFNCHNELCSFCQKPLESEEIAEVVVFR